VTEIRLLGQVDVWAAGKSIPAGQPRQRAVLAALAVDAGRLVTWDTLIDRVWGEAPPDGVRQAIYAHITRVRRLLAQGHALSPTAPEMKLIRQQGGYVLETTVDRIDLHRFRMLAERSRARQCPDDERICRLDEALRLWRGTPLAGLPGAWATRVRETWQGHRLEVVAAWAQALRRTGQADAAIGALTELLGDNPLSELLVLELMQAYTAGGRSIEALECYDAMRRRLATELGVPPSADLRNLHRAILRGEARAVSGSPRAQAIPAQLPSAPPSFTGRAGSLAALDAWAGPGGIVVVAGVGGVGKTALVVHWSHRRAARFPEGQLFIDLGGYSPAAPMAPIEALSWMLYLLGVPGEQIPADTQQAAALYRSHVAGRRMLIVLDNVADAEQVRPLLPGSPTCHVIITSRARLAALNVTHDCRQLTLAPLSPGEGLYLLETLIGTHRTAAEPAAAAELLRLCGNLPLAIRIASARLAHRPQRRLADQVSTLDSDVLSGLAVPGDSGTAVRAVFDRSYDRLTPTEQRLFRCIGLCPGSTVGVPALATMAGIDLTDAERIVDRLIEYCLIEQPLHGRCGMHDLIRAYAKARALSDEDTEQRDAALKRLAGWYLSTVRQAVEICGSDHRGSSEIFAGPVEANAWLDAEMPNLVAMARHAADAGPRPAAWQLAQTLREYLWRRRERAAWEAIARAGLRAAEADNDLNALAACHRVAANMELSRSRHAEAIGHYRAALRFGQASGSEHERYTRCGLAQTYRELGRLDQAESLLLESLVLVRDNGNAAVVADVLSRLGLLYTESGSARAAVTCLTEALDRYHAAGAQLRQSEVHNNLAQALCLTGELDSAMHHVLAGKEIALRFGDRVGEANKLDTLAVVRREMGRLDQALDDAHTALSIALRLDDRRIQAHASNTIGTTYLRLGDPDEAARLHRRALALAVDNGVSYARVAGLIGLANAIPDADSALTAAREALHLARRFGYRVFEGQSLIAAARAHAGAGRFDTTRALVGEAMSIHHAYGHLACEAAALALAEAQGWAAT